MTTEDKDLLYKDLCARLPYGVKGIVTIETDDWSRGTDINGNPSAGALKLECQAELIGITQNKALFWFVGEESLTDCFDELQEEVGFDVTDFKPYLRPIQSMTKEEEKELRDLLCCDEAPKDCPLIDFDFSIVVYYSHNEDSAENECYDMKVMLKYIDWLNEHHFDYRGLIKKGLALEATEGMYKN